MRLLSVQGTWQTGNGRLAVILLEIVGREVDRRKNKVWEVGEVENRARS